MHVSLPQKGVCITQVDTLYIILLHCIAVHILYEVLYNFCGLID